MTAARLVPALLLVVAACLPLTWNEISPGAPPRDGTIAVVGELTLIPPVEQQTRAYSGVVLVGAARDRMYGVFTTDLKRPFGPDLWEDGDAHYSVLLPLEGPFFIEIPRRPWRLYLRGVVVMTDRGRTGVEVPVQIAIRPEDDIVYIGHLYVQRTSPRWTQVREEESAARQAARQIGHVLATRPWTVQLARPLENGGYPSSSDKVFAPVPLQVPPAH
ncbi:MAG TPA: hypothetical protein VF516_09800 [Kofleriaceae bacterium]